MNSHYAFYFKTRSPRCCYLFIFSFTFNMLLGKIAADVQLHSQVGGITAFTFLNLKQLTIIESSGVGKTSCIARIPCDSTVFCLSYFTLWNVYMNHGRENFERHTEKRTQWRFALPAAQDQNHIGISYILAKLNGYIKMSQEMNVLRLRDWIDKYHLENTRISVFIIHKYTVTCTNHPAESG